MSGDAEAAVRGVARTLAQVSGALESADHPLDRVRRVLELTADLLPYQRCALLRRTSGGGHDLLVVPAATGDEEEALRTGLLRVLRLVEQAEEIGRSTDPRRSLTLPVIGLDQVIGMLQVEPPDDVAYEASHVRLLSVVAAQLGGYLTMLGLREQEAGRMAELAAAHDFQQLLAGVVSHDLRNPLSVIITVSQSLLRTTRDPRQIKGLERALNSARRAAHIINDLLDVTHIRATGQMRLNRRPVDLHALLTGLLEDLRIAHPGRELRLETVNAGAATGEWDPDRLGQAAINLIHNALQHGDPHAPVRVVLEARADEILLSTHNRGPPIAPTALGTLFDPFKRGSQGARPVGGGLGLGLYIADQIVKYHRGSLTVQSSLDEGTTFCLRLPRQLPSPAAEDTSQDLARR